ncbi:hypothetical protein F5Y04DRAFT_156976 [Hypomontagnella monticulosa]|nr:hypothetical protein F5Y04DRAFT_156976 [Hypomontagnella monticulosa]
MAPRLSICLSLTMVILVVHMQPYIVAYTPFSPNFYRMSYSEFERSMREQRGGKRTSNEMYMRFKWRGTASTTWKLLLTYLSRIYLRVLYIRIQNPTCSVRCIKQALILYKAEKCVLMKASTPPYYVYITRTKCLESYEFPMFQFAN